MLALFNFKIYYKKGSKNRAADALSKCLDYILSIKLVYIVVLVSGLNSIMQYNHLRLIVILVRTKNKWDKLYN